MKKILIIDESLLFSNYLTKTLEKQGFLVMEARNGLDGSIKMRNELPDLLIMDYNLSRKSSMEILKERLTNPNTSGIPVFILSPAVDKQKLMALVGYNIDKFFTKPIKIDELLYAIADVLHTEVLIDSTPCVIETHFNDDILFVEISRGLNREKIELLKYKIIELMELYQVQLPKVLIMVSGIELTAKDSGKLKLLLETIFEHPLLKPAYAKILTNSQVLKSYVTHHEGFKSIGVADNLREAMDELWGLKPDVFAHDEVMREKLLTVSTPQKNGIESIQMGFDHKAEIAETLKNRLLKKPVMLAVVDDDVAIRQMAEKVFQETSWQVKGYADGREFVLDLVHNDFDLVFLDLVMPDMNGVQVLEYLKQKGFALPIIVLSALSRRETVVHVMKLGVKSYMIKPIKASQILTKTLEILNRIM